MSPSRSTAPSSQALARLCTSLVLACLARAAFAAETPTPGPEKAPPHATIGPAVPLSDAQRAAIAAKPTTALPAPEPSAVATKQAPYVAAPPVEMTSKPVLSAAALAAATEQAARLATMTPSSRPVRNPRAWTTSPSLGAIPRLEWQVPAMRKDPDAVWFATPDGGRRVLVTGGER